MSKNGVKCLYTKTQHVGRLGTRFAKPEEAARAPASVMT
jgi:hypothetical protein